MKLIYYLFLCKCLWSPSYLLYCSKGSVVSFLCLKVVSVVTQRLQLRSKEKERGLTLNGRVDYVRVCAPVVPFSQASQSSSQVRSIQRHCCIGPSPSWCSPQPRRTWAFTSHDSRCPLKIQLEIPYQCVSKFPIANSLILRLC